jgi:acyl dehydratase
MAGYYRVQACNLSHASENKIHDEAVARRFGFGGALVAGVEVYAYMAHLPVARWGVEWLERGTAECRFVKPVYDARVVTVSATESAGTLSIAVESEGERCANGTAALPELASGTAALSAYEAAPTPDPAARPDASEATLSPGRRLSSRPLHLTQAELDRYLADIREALPLYGREKLVHPAFMLRLANLALKDNVKLGPWIHLGSSIAHCGLARAGDTLRAHAIVAANYEQRGHRIVDLEVVIVAEERGPVAQVRHTAIYQPRQSARVYKPTETE